MAGSPTSSVNRAGETALAFGIGAQAAFLAPGVAALDARVEHGLRDDLELDVGGAIYAVLGHNENDEHRGIYSARFGLRYRLASWVALAGGLGGGYSPAAGAFAGADLGVVITYYRVPRQKCIPYLTLRGLVGIPFRTRLVRADVTARAHETVGGSLEFGFNVPIPPARRFSFYTAFAMTLLFDGQGDRYDTPDELLSFGAATGFRVTLDPPPRPPSRERSIGRRSGIVTP